MAEVYICSLSKVQRHAEICKEINDLYERKNHDYGDSFHQTFVEEGMAMARIRLGDKFSRFKTLSRGGEQKVNGESMTLSPPSMTALSSIIRCRTITHGSAKKC